MTPTTEQQAQLAAEMNAAIVPDYMSVSELVEYRAQIAVGTSGKTKIMTFGEVVAAYKDIDGQIEALESRKKDLKMAAQAAVLMSGRDKVRAEGYQMSRVVKQGTKKISDVKLMKAGVSVEIIAACTEIGKSSEYFEIRAIKEPK